MFIFSGTMLTFWVNYICCFLGPQLLVCSKSKVPVWPFLLLSCFGGAYALLPYFILWNPPAPPIEETELKSWPLIFLESKVTAMIGYSKVDILCLESGKQRIILMD
ncbi:uncharacterized protein LOC130981687 [Arachis stenosperma]|uniref:uncharacterized protein LOC130981687 n=1 Tax=Arachis stenosperma TaxID=217475 RepID=UPI0025AC5BC1|nr:uncharacterized protein LOC130981687 [Arachis stenosperma]